ncbi:hypothetical protein [Catenulispora pinisilvae]|uniref:hypothetical protein n=1 Tax=Catenulispora pinisilvae TaxID=2705253 RepID=UPI00189113D4|nr:hypothetical protein [Catenulispora pinisilvae]
MNVRGLEVEYVEIDPATAWPIQPWAAVVQAAEARADTEAMYVPAPGGSAGSTPRKAGDRGASAVEWVVITAIVVAIVTGVGVLIANAVKAKASSACKQIANTDTTNTIAGAAGNGGSSANCG